MRRWLPALLWTLACLAAFPSAAAAQIATAVPASPVVVDGPSAGIQQLNGLSVARDGSGALVYLKSVAGTSHVFVSALVEGVFQPPQEVDAGLAGSSSQPVIAAGNDGVVLVAFINGGQLYVVDRAGPSGAYTAPLDLIGAAGNPSLAMTNLGKGYLAFSTSAGGGSAVRTGYYYAGRWSLESTPLNAVPGDNAGTGTGRPSVAAAGDGVAIVVWGEAGHIYARRVWGTSPSTAIEQADVPSLAGWSEISADQPVVAAGGDSSYADVAFHEVLASPDGSTRQARVLMNRLRGSIFDGVTQPDGLSTPGSEGADQPQLAMTEYGRGFATSARDSSGQTFAELLGGNGSSLGTVRVDTLANASAPYPVPADAGLFSTAIAWQHDPGSPGVPEIRVRYAPNGSDLGPELAVSDPSLGPTDAANGLAAAGDFDGDAVVAWVQGPPGAMQIVTAQLYKPPGGFAAQSSFRYATSSLPTLNWSVAHDLWGPVSYRLSIDGAPIGQTTATSFSVPGPLPDGPHRWQVSAVNRAGLRSMAVAATVWVDTAAPTATVSIAGVRRVGSRIRLSVSSADAAPPPLPATDASGVARVMARWGDGSVNRIRRVKFHRYTHPGRYRLTVLVTDRAGNTTTIVRELLVAPRMGPQSRRPLRPRRPGTHL